PHSAGPDRLQQVITIDRLAGQFRRRARLEVRPRCFRNQLPAGVAAIDVGMDLIGLRRGQGVRDERENNLVSQALTQYRILPQMNDLEAILASLENLVSDEKGLTLLQERWLAACQAWPTVSLPLERFLRRWDETLAPQTQLGDVLEKVFFEDLLLAIACREGDRAALAIFDKRFLAPIATYLGK